MSFDFSIPGPSGEIPISIEPGTSVVFVGANGGGKTRLAVHIENVFNLNAHRISAHRALTINPGIAKISEQKARSGLRTGHGDDNPNVANRLGSRWRSNMATSLLNDFDFLLQVLFAEQSNKALETHKKNRAGDHSLADSTVFERLVTTWDQLLPHRKLHISGDNIEVSVSGSDSRYSAADMSDGERAIFYMIAQTLVAAEGSLLIFDEPELHVHPSIMAKLWDELEASRQDCSFIFITHELEFAATRVAQKFVILDFDPTPSWSIEVVPENSGFSEEITTLILGSRHPILFIEGDENSLDLAIYRCCFPKQTVIPRGSCEEVIHSVVTMRRNKELTRVACSGIVDADDYQADDIARLSELGIFVLPVSEIENVILLPDVSRAIAKSEGYKGVALRNLLRELKTAIFDTLKTGKTMDAVVTRYCRRRIDRILKKIDLSEASSISDITAEYNRQTTTLNIVKIAQQANDRIEEALRDDDLPKLLANYDSKGLMALAARHLKKSKRVDFESWLTRVLRNNSEPELVKAIRKCLPKIKP